MTTLLIATRNAHKVGEIRAILGDNFRYLTLADFSAAPTTSFDYTPTTTFGVGKVEYNAQGRNAPVTAPVPQSCWKDTSGGILNLGPWRLNSGKSSPILHWRPVISRAGRLSSRRSSRRMLRPVRHVMIAAVISPLAQCWNWRRLTVMRSPLSG